VTTMRMTRAPRRGLVVTAVLVAVAALAWQRSGVDADVAHPHGPVLPDVAGAVLPDDLDALESAVGGAVVTHGAGRPARAGAGRGETYPTGTLAAEPTLGIDADGAIYYQAIAVGTGPLEGVVMRSDDEGRTFKEISPRLGPGRRHAATFDPFLHLDRETGRVFTVDLTLVGCSTASSTDDGGATWAIGKACGLTDHQNVFTGPPVTSTTVGYPNVVYYCAIDAGLLAAFGTATSCLKSLDGGVSFARTGAPAFTDDPRQEGGILGIPGHCGGATGHGFADDEGVVYLPRGWCGQPYLAISRDEGLTWQRVQVAENGVPVNEAAQIEEHEAAVAADAAGTIYYVWTARDRLPYLATSSDGGQTWSAPVLVSPPGVTEASLPSVAVGDEGRIAIAYIGSTEAPGGPAPDGSGTEYAGATWHGYLTTSVDADEATPTFHTVTVNDPGDPLVRGSCGIPRCQQQFDFIDVEIAPDGTPWTALADGCPDPDATEPADCRRSAPGSWGAWSAVPAWWWRRREVAYRPTEMGDVPDRRYGAARRRLRVDGPAGRSGGCRRRRRRRHDVARRGALARNRRVHQPGRDRRARW
jgi:hypothetical protein